MSAREGGHRVLVVEGDPQTAEDLRALVASRGDVPTVAATVEQALGALAGGSFCYAIVDQQLPARTGETSLLAGGERVLVAARKADDRRPGGFHSTPIVVLTSYAGHEDFVARMYDLGASAFLSRPLAGNVPRLLDRVGVALERAKRATHADCAAVERAPAAEGPAEEEDVGAARSGSIAEQLGAKAFAEIAVRAIDRHTLRITHRRKRVHATFVDLGLATKTRAPTCEWTLLLDVCAGHGVFQWKRYGTINNAKQRVFVLRRKLKAAFGMDDEPFHKFRVVDGWRARFFASSEVARAEEG